ncbi:MAG: hypothetical protein QF486_00305 [Candidatus Woesearchaeota archaeon]|jgi:hypothetical protein|nr:hypothetical protein [Candidatus Woesearchaeota archaeon]MDP7181335.1 hypothetical protein [Candidatus Woesearchaeota archaeon]MDP7198046.1 hypothetical protein [Candidatus Woesearchaeota archaeon]MDP7466880.1 hypothetical protein [Candidatus Woesearchaeota archaeon]MDP7647316.1 hypothetical protein [Candidatus Woesearchaeota archaeon]|tara:strand:- start:34 stop:447 length:414 start_codon:yes stop_codon:yes gene_type:complete
MTLFHDAMTFITGLFGATHPVVDTGEQKRIIKAALFVRTFLEMIKELYPPTTLPDTMNVDATVKSLANRSCPPFVIDSVGPIIMQLVDKKLRITFGNSMYVGGQTVQARWEGYGGKTGIHAKYATKLYKYLETLGII